MRLPWEKDLGETPARSETTEEAHQFPHRKANYFPTNPCPHFSKGPNYLEFESSSNGSLSLKQHPSFGSVEDLKPSFL
ncbi:hypothetical protein SAMN05216353_14328 [Halobacillus alkaliphilus]|uniref:Uncharacterized protein n=1 Tax=Halobacillus alkaliphilus TaxID=396056 RepID=A0A1I2RU72_9BACI|nr:hypothetical protein SAMN05216353_14328 [Halobacillus alkaliphilus]